MGTTLDIGSHDNKETFNVIVDKFDKPLSPSSPKGILHNHNNNIIIDDTTISEKTTTETVLDNNNVKNTFQHMEKKSPRSSISGTNHLMSSLADNNEEQQLLHLRNKQQQLLILRQQLQQRHTNTSNNSGGNTNHHHKYNQHHSKPSIFKFVDKTKSKLNWWRYVNCLSHKSHRFSNSTLVQICQDWLFLALLGIIMAILSFSMDSVITLFLRTRLWLYSDISGDNVCIQYLGWCTMPIILVAFSTGFVHVFSPAAVGSGIPEMKTILRGVILNEYLTFRTLIGKIVGLTFTLGSGLPLGKEGPFVHMASIVATLLSKLVASFQGIYENESRTSEMLSAACAVGVAATFYAPIGGVLFSIEITTVYFAVRNYWRGFFAACCGATIWRLLSFWIKNDESISAIFKTNFKPDFPFDPFELVAFSFIGATCGLAGAAYIKFHREIVQVFRRHRRLSQYLHNNRFVYPIVVTFIITTVTFPPLFGKYTASTLSTHDTIEQLFSNKTWSLDELDLETETMLNDWTTPNTGFHLHLVLYIVMKFWTSALASTIPIPSGLFIPVLKMGAAYGRLLGEIMAQLFPDGIHYGHYVHPAAIVPGSYAVVGAAAFSGAVTHTISTSVILFEMTGQIVHIIPVILAVLISNAVCQSLQPSIYDSIIEMKKLPYLPPIASSNSVSHKILVRDFMTQKIAYIWKEKCTYRDLKTVLRLHRRVNSFPLVQSSETKILLGSIPRVDLLKLLYLKLNREQRLQEFRRRTSIENQNQTLLHRQHVGTIGASDNLFKQQNYRTESNPIHQQQLVNVKTSKCDSSNDGIILNPIQAARTHSDNIDIQESQVNERSDQSIILMKTQLSKSASALGRTNSHMSQDSHHDYEKIDDIDPLKLGRTSIARSINLYNKQSILSKSSDDKVINESQREIYSDDIGRSSENNAIAILTDAYTSQNTANSKKGESREEFLIRMASISQSTESSSTSTSSDDELISRNSSEEKIIGSISVDQNTHAISSNLSLLAVDLELALKDINNSKNTTNTNDNYNNKNQLSVCASNGSEVRLSPTRSILKPCVTDYSKKFIDTKIQYNLDQESGHRRRLRSLTSRKDLNINNSSVIEVPRKKRSVRLPRLRVIDTTPEEQEEWEQEQLRSYVDFSKCQVDAAPFQLVEQTSLYRVHTLFSMLGLNHAYVTSVGRLVGIVALRDIRHAIEEMNTGEINFRKSINRPDVSIDKKAHAVQNGRSSNNNTSKSNVPDENQHTSTDEELYSKL